MIILRLYHNYLYATIYIYILYILNLIFIKSNAIIFIDFNCGGLLCIIWFYLLHGNGTTLQCVIDNIRKKKLDAKINLVVSDNKDAYALERAKKENIPIYIIKNKSTEDVDIELENVLKNYDIDLIVLVGYLKLIGKRLISKYTIINTHPSLLPKFGGKGMFGMNVHKAVVEAHEKVTGPTVHFVNDKYDEGNIISQEIIDVLDTDTPEDVSRKVQEIEKIQLIRVLKDFISKKNEG